MTVCNTGMVPGELTHLAPLGTSVPMGIAANGQQLVCAVDNDPINILTPFISMFLHGGWLHTAEAESPHHLLPKMKAHLHFGHASDDSSMTAEDITRLEAALRAWGGRFESETYPAKHGWCLSDFPIHDPEQAARAWGKLLALFRESL